MFVITHRNVNILGTVLQNVEHDLQIYIAKFTTQHPDIN